MWFIIRVLSFALSINLPLVKLNGQEFFDQKDFASWFAELDTSNEHENAHLVLNRSLKLEIDSYVKNSPKPISLVKVSESLKRISPNCPSWVIETIRDAKIPAKMDLTLDLPKLDRVPADKYFTLDRQVKKTGAERQLLGKICADLFPFDLEPNGRERFITCAYSHESRLACRFVFTEDVASSYVVGCDSNGIRWIQRCWSKIDMASSGPRPKNVAAMWTENETAMLAVLSERSISIEGFRFDSGAVVIRLNSDLSWGKSP